MSCEMFHGATGISIKKSRISNVGRDQYQYNDCTIHQTIVEKRAKTNRDLPELSGFTEIKQGDIDKLGDICYSWRLCSNGKDDTEAAVYTTQIMIAGHFGDSKYTVKTYHGQNEKKGCSTIWI
ncbi:hypothetical protein L218DRAFT_965331 [Marasmius fiardii PR-910]|nr:hypothetical protein L218DRAFT_965331 [Marasmius fiardii PR-910]